MRPLTPQELIRAVPLDDVYREKLLNEYDRYDDGRKYEILNILWDAFDDMKLFLRTIIRDQLMKQMSEGKLGVGTNIQEEVEKKLWEQIEDFISGKSKENEKLEQVRSQLEKLMTVQHSQQKT